MDIVDILDILDMLDIIDILDTLYMVDILDIVDLLDILDLLDIVDMLDILFVLDILDKCSSSFNSSELKIGHYSSIYFRTQKIKNSCLSNITELRSQRNRRIILKLFQDFNLNLMLNLGD